MKLASLINHIEDYSPEHQVVIRWPDGTVANISGVTLKAEIGVVVIVADAVKPVENALAEPPDLSKAPMGTSPDDADLQGTGR